MPAIDVPFHDSRNSMEHWWPRLSGVDVPKPETVLIPFEASEDGPLPIEWDTQAIIDAVESLPTDQAFVRTDWKSVTPNPEGSYIPSTHPEAVDETVMCLLLSVSNLDFVASSLVIRELLDLDERADGLGTPVAPEVRVFIDDGEVRCHHLRVDESDLRTSAADADAVLSEMEETVEAEWATIRSYAERVAQEFSETGWSVDFLRTEDGEWVCTDMALYGLYYDELKDEDGRWKSISYHPADCPHNLEENPPDSLPAQPQNPRNETQFKHPDP